MRLDSETRFPLLAFFFLFPSVSHDLYQQLQPIVCQQCNAQNHADTDQELSLTVTLTLNVRFTGGKSDLSVIVGARRAGLSDFETADRMRCDLSLEFSFTQNGVKYKQCFCKRRGEVRGEWADSTLERREMPRWCR